jgi:SSS family solute:Na+ symporter/sodium/proline symporter
MPQFLEKRYNSKFLKIYASIIIFVFMVPYSASVYQGLGYIFENAFGLPMNYVLILLAALTGFYVILGGYISTAKNSLIQGIIIFIGVVILFVSFFNNPDIGGLFQGFFAMAENFGSEGYANVLGTDPALLISLVILTSLGTWGLPQMVHKFYSVDESKINHSAVASTVLALVIAGGFYLMGGFSRLYFLNSGIPVPEDLQLLMPVILENILSPVMFAIVAILLLAASMSTLASLVLVSSSSFIIDLVQELFYKNKEVDEKKTLLWIRITCFIFTVLSFAIATTPNTIINLLSLSWGTMAGAFIGPYLWGLYIEDLRKEAAIAASVISVAVMIIGVNVLGAQMTPMIGSAAIFSSLILTVVIHYIIMVFDRRKAYKTE